MKFKPGNLVTHTPTKSVWIIVNANKRDTGRFLREVNAFCLYAGPPSSRGNTYWKVGILDTWLLTKEDIDPTDNIWQVENAV